MSGLLAGLPNLIAAAGLTLYTVTRSGPPESLADTLGWWSYVWTLIIIASLIISGVLAFAQSRIGAMKAETVVRPLAGCFLASYGLGLLFGNLASPSWITIGFSLAIAVGQIRRWHTLSTVFIPEAEAVRAIRRQEGAV